MFFCCWQFLPKNEQKQVDMRHQGSKVEFFRSFFGRIKRHQKTFRNYLTFRETWLIVPDNLGWNLIGVTRVQGSKAPFWKVKAWLCLLTCRLSSFSFWATNKLSNFSTWKSLQHFEPYSHETISLDALFSSQLSNTNLPINAARLKQPLLSLRLRNDL